MIMGQVKHQRWEESKLRTALQKALDKHPGSDPDFIVKFGCPDMWGVGKEPSWCGTREDKGRTCRECWELPAVEEEE